MRVIARSCLQDAGEEIVGLIRGLCIAPRLPTDAQSERGPSDRYVGALLVAADGRDASDSDSAGTACLIGLFPTI